MIDILVQLLFELLQRPPPPGPGQPPPPPPGPGGPPPPPGGGNFTGRGPLNLTRDNFAIFYLSYSGYSTLLFVCLCLIGISLVLQICFKLKPIRDKHLMPYFALIPVILVSIQKLVTSNLRIQELADVACHFFLFGVWPLSLTSIVGLSIYAFKYILIKKLTFLRQVYQEQMIHNTHTEDMSDLDNKSFVDEELMDMKDEMLDKDFENAMNNQAELMDPDQQKTATTAIPIADAADQFPSETNKPIAAEADTLHANASAEQANTEQLKLATLPPQVVNSPASPRSDEPLNNNNNNNNSSSTTAATSTKQANRASMHNLQRSASAANINTSKNDSNEDAMTSVTNNNTATAVFQAQQQQHQIFMALQRLNSTWVLLLVVIAFLILFYIASIVVYFSLPSPDDSVQGRCESMRFIGKFLQMGAIVAAMLGLAILLLFDMFTNMKDTLKCRWLTICYFDDPLFYRLELSLLLIIVVIYVAVSIPINIALRRDFRVLNMFETIAELVFYFAMMAIIPGISVVTSIYKGIQTCVMKRKFAKQEKAKQEFSISLYSPTSETIEFMLKHEKISKAFKRFASLEFSLENVLFWEQITQFKKSFSRKKKQTQQRIIAKAKRIYDAYLCSTAVIDVNMPNAVKEQVKNAIKEAEKNSKEKPLTATLFEACETEVMRNLLDTYSRFFKSRQFKTVLAQL